MPPTGKLPAEALAKIEAWVKAGAVLPDSRSAPASKPAATGVFSQARTSHWAFQPVRDYAPPTGESTAWARSPVDRFILAKLEEKGPPPAPPRAGKLTLIRRAKYDLLGLASAEAKSANSSQTTLRMHSRSWSTACWRRRSMARSGAGTGWTWRATPNPAGSTKTTPTPKPGAIANT